MEKIGLVIANITCTCKKCYGKVMHLKSQPGPYREGYPAWHHACERPVSRHSRNIKAGSVSSYPSPDTSSHFSLETFQSKRYPLFLCVSRQWRGEHSFIPEHVFTQIPITSSSFYALYIFICLQQSSLFQTKSYLSALSLFIAMLF